MKFEQRITMDDGVEMTPSGIAYIEAIKQIKATQKFLVIDLEGTCFEGANAFELSDVIEIGLALLDTQKMQEALRLQWYTRPTMTLVSDFCTKLTGIHPHHVNGAASFAQRMKDLDHFIDEHNLTLWGSYGGYDRNQFQRQCRREGLPNPMDRLEHINLKKIVTTHLGLGKKRPGLRKALEVAGLEHEGLIHSGVDDAHNILRITTTILKESRHPEKTINQHKIKF